MSSESKNGLVKRAVAAVAGVLLGAGFIALCPADAGLSEQGVRCLGILFGAVVWWVGGVLPAYATGIAMVVLFAVVARIDSSVAFSAFSASTWWLLVAAFGLGAGMKRSGLLRRMAHGIVRVFPNTFIAQVAGLMAAGTLVGPLVPSMAAKVTMLTPLSMGIGDALGYERYSKPMQGLFLAMFCGVRSVAPAVLSASVIGYCLLGLLPADVQAQFDLLHWLLAALPWFVIVTVLTFASIAVLYRPKGEGTPTASQTGLSQNETANDDPNMVAAQAADHTQSTPIDEAPNTTATHGEPTDDASSVVAAQAADHTQSTPIDEAPNTTATHGEPAGHSPNVVAAQAADHMRNTPAGSTSNTTAMQDGDESALDTQAPTGTATRSPDHHAPMSRYEKRMCAIIVVTVALWVAEPLHHVPAHIVALAAFVLTVACGILGKAGLREDISWESLVFVGIAIGLANVLQTAGVQDWVITAAGPAFQALVGNPYLFMTGAALITVALRFIIVSEMAYLNIVMVFLVPLSVSAGVNPWVVGFAMYAVITPWFAIYQSATYLAAFYSVDGKMVHHADMAKYCVLYTAICLAALIPCVPYWQGMGLL